MEFKVIKVQCPYCANFSFCIEGPYEKNSFQVHDNIKKQYIPVQVSGYHIHESRCLYGTNSGFGNRQNDRMLPSLESLLFGLT